MFEDVQQPCRSWVMEWILQPKEKFQTSRLRKGPYEEQSRDIYQKTMLCIGEGIGQFKNFGKGNLALAFI